MSNYKESLHSLYLYKISYSEIKNEVLSKALQTKNQQKPLLTKNKLELTQHQQLRKLPLVTDICDKP